MRLSGREPAFRLAVDRVVVTCEHGGNRVPARYVALFRGQQAALRSHRGFDAGALAMARQLARAMQAPLFAATTTRLLIDLNRSLGHPRLYSRASRAAPAETRAEILERCYLPYRSRVEAWIADAVRQGHRVLHISSHSFTPVLDDRRRDADIGLLYDPGRPSEALLCELWRQHLAAHAPTLKVRRNYPYRGTSDGFAAALRRRFSGDVYLGVELEINQKHVTDAAQWRRLRAVIVQTLRAIYPAVGEVRQECDRTH